MRGRHLAGAGKKAAMFTLLDGSLKPAPTVPYTITLRATSVPLFMWGSPLTLAHTSRLVQVLTPPSVTEFWVPSLVPMITLLLHLPPDKYPKF